MSRSYRKPYGTYCNIHNSAHYDKQLAARGVRRRQDEWLRNHWDDESGLVPHRYECCHNDVWGWNRDGTQFLFTLTGRDWNRHLEAWGGTGLWAGDRNYMVWPPLWYQDMMRK